MENFHNRYKAQAVNHKVSEELTKKTLLLMEAEQDKNNDTGYVKNKRSFRWRVLIPVCVLCTLLAISATAYALDHFLPRYTPHINAETPEEIYTQQGDSAITDNDSNIGIKVLKTAADSDHIYVTFEVKTLDGSPFYKDYTIKPLDETGYYVNYNSIEEYQYYALQFQKIHIEYEGEIIEGAAIRTDNGSKDNYASYEFIGWGDLDGIENGQATIVFTDFVLDRDNRENNLDKIYDLGEFTVPIEINATGVEILSTNITIPDENVTLSLNTVELSNFKITLSGTYKGEGELFDLNLNDLYLIFRDGTKELASSKGVAGVGGNGTFRLDWIFSSIKNSEDIIALELMGTRIDLR